MSSLSSQRSTSQDPAGQSRDAAVIATGSLAALSSVKGTQASELAAQASSIQDTLPHLSAAERAITTRSGIVTFFFGGDKASANDIQNHVAEDMAALDSMDTIINDPSTSPAIKSFATQRESQIRADLQRLKGLADSELQKRGLFG